MRVGEDGQLGLTEHIDEAGRNDETVRVDSAASGDVGQVPDGCDPAMLDCDVGGVPRRAGSVDNVAVANENIDLLLGEERSAAE
jgi:hypothetical protein